VDQIIVDLKHAGCRGWLRNNGIRKLEELNIEGGCKSALKAKVLLFIIEMHGSKGQLLLRR